VEGSCQRRNEPSGSIKSWEVLKWLHDWRLLKKGSAPRVSEWYRTTSLRFYTPSSRRRSALLVIFSIHFYYWKRESWQICFLEQITHYISALSETVFTSLTHSYQIPLIRSYHFYFIVKKLLFSIPTLLLQWPVDINHGHFSSTSLKYNLKVLQFLLCLSFRNKFETKCSFQCKTYQVYQYPCLLRAHKSKCNFIIIRLACAILYFFAFVSCEHV
jgi:hypothetical protein